MLTPYIARKLSVSSPAEVLYSTCLWKHLLSNKHRSMDYIAHELYKSTFPSFSPSRTCRHTPCFNCLALLYYFFVLSLFIFTLFVISSIISFDNTMLVCSFVTLFLKMMGNSFVFCNGCLSHT